jgi:2-polyprenyl-6-methoxyphenol hydroxylase-like FAD-dependent oxidoreductase
MERTQVAIIGGGPAGMLLSHMLHLDGIDSVVIERQTKDHVLKRIRAGVLEYGTVKLLRELGLGERMEREGQAHDGAAAKHSSQAEPVDPAIRTTHSCHSILECELLVGT